MKFTFDIHKTDSVVFPHGWEVVVGNHSSSGGAVNQRAARKAIRRLLRKRLGWWGYWKARRDLP